MIAGNNQGVADSPLLDDLGRSAQHSTLPNCKIQERSRPAEPDPKRTSQSFDFTYKLPARKQTLNGKANDRAFAAGGPCCASRQPASVSWQENNAGIRLKALIAALIHGRQRRGLVGPVSTSCSTPKPFRHERPPRSTHLLATGRPKSRCRIGCRIPYQASLPQSVTVAGYKPRTVRF